MHCCVLWNILGGGEGKKEKRKKGFLPFPRMLDAFSILAKMSGHM